MILVREVPSNVLLLWDEAYYEFGRHAGGPETLPLFKLRKGPWFCTRTFSKAYGLAGIRVGYGIASSSDIAGAIRRCRPNYSVNAVALAGAVAALNASEHSENLLAHIARERDRLVSFLEQLGCQPLKSCANFVAVKTPVAADHLAAALERSNIHLMSFHWEGTNGALRITIGDAGATDAVSVALKLALQSC
ncbi:hypothetical protein RvVAR0630_pl05240 (plasmid) [Agrobacterium vitis]|nr:hypothetical protein RvVAR0630_pl05240 [Agrobacterium vitis]